MGSNEPAQSPLGPVYLSQGFWCCPCAPSRLSAASSSQVGQGCVLGASLSRCSCLDLGPAPLLLLVWGC